MKSLISPADMQACEKRYFEASGVPSIEIMENAARALADTAVKRFPDAKDIYIACGPGGNGGDGYACARILTGMGRRCRIYASAPAKNADAVENARRAAECGIGIAVGKLPEYHPDLWIDCLYGTGLSREPSGFSAELIRRIYTDHRHARCGVVACDIPSGLNGQTGKAYAPCVQADVTVTFQYGKYGLYLQDGLDMCGTVIAADVGFPRSAFLKDMVHLVQADDLKPMLPAGHKRNVHKGSNGHLLIVAGSVGMAGAAALCARAALRSGAGLVTVACAEEIVPILQIHAPCAMCIPLPQQDGAISEDALPVLKEALKGKTAFAVGPGLSRRVPAEIIRVLLESGLPGVIDADALNIISENPALKKLLKYQHIITPHPGEAARLLGRRIEDPVEDARALAEMGCCAVLKGASRVICGEAEAFISTGGCSGMARGGSGDVLTGLTGGLLAAMHPNRYDLLAVVACEIHGLAGEKAYGKYGRCMNAADIIEFLPEVFRDGGR